MSSVCFRCGERNPAFIHTCSPFYRLLGLGKEHEPQWKQLELDFRPPCPPCNQDCNQGRSCSQRNINDKR